MSKALQWTFGISAVLIVLAVAFSIVFPLVAPQLGWAGGDYAYGPRGMMGPWHMYGGGPMMGGFGMPLFGVGMFIAPLLFIGLLVLGIVWLVRTVSAPGAPAAPLATCAHCGKPVQAGWKACPYCGEKI